MIDDDKQSGENTYNTLTAERTHAFDVGALKEREEAGSKVIRRSWFTVWLKLKRKGKVTLREQMFL